MNDSPREMHRRGRPSLHRDRRYSDESMTDVKMHVITIQITEEQYQWFQQHAQKGIRAKLFREALNQYMEDHSQ